MVSLFPLLSSIQILPYDGETIYFGKVFDELKATALYNELLLSVAWEHDVVKMMGRLITTKRKVAWMADGDFTYAYSHTEKKALPWQPRVAEIKSFCESISGATFNSCLLNLYHSGDEGVTWHSDNEATLLPKGAIASVSLGAERKFRFKHKRTKEQIEITLEHGSLLLMRGETQRAWLHELPKSAKVKTPRVNLTFRTYIGRQP
ncbi:MAG: alpha-ketoglutarate-dependent dioxygenase AlkB [Chloroherpetonaceae bacterium]|nr:alpha-ketoglutarate-dependent dioxygenase AlkB [Chloroherpetonaceae bacterium]